MSTVQERDTNLSRHSYALTNETEDCPEVVECPQFDENEVVNNEFEARVIEYMFK